MSDETTLVKRGNPARWRRRLLLLAFACAVIGVALLGLRLWETRGSEAAVGIYMTGDGQSYVVIEKRAFGGLCVTAGQIALEEFYWSYEDDRTIEARFRHGRLILDQQQQMRARLGYLCDRRLLHCVFEPSSTRPGDWDLVYAFGRRALALEDSILKEGFLRCWATAQRKWERIKYPKMTRRRNRPLTDEWTWPPSRSPIRSFLSRVNDVRLIEYVEDRLDDLDRSKSRDLARQLATDHPDHPLLALHHIEQEARNGERETARRLWDEWEAEHWDDAETFTQQQAWRAYGNLAKAEFRHDFPGAPSYLDVFKQGTTSTIEMRLDYMREALAIDRLELLDRPVIHPLHKRPIPYEPFIDGVAFRDAVTSACALSTTALLEGDKQESLTLLSATYRLGQTLNADGGIGNRLWGMNARTRAIGGLEAHIQTCETTDDIGALWSALRRLHETPGQEDGSRMRLGWGDALADQMLHDAPGMMGGPGAATGPFMFDPSDQAIARSRAVDTMFQALRVSTAAREFTLKSGAPPSTPDDLAMRFPDGLPVDPFTTKTTRLQLTVTSATCAASSIGPDQKDDARAIRYDPTNGTYSCGDIYIEIPRR